MPPALARIGAFRKCERGVASGGTLCQGVTDVEFEVIPDPFFYALAIPAVIFAGISKGGFGGGAAFAAAPFLALAMEPLEAVAVMLPVLMAIDAATLRAYWGKWDRTHARVLIAGSVFGILLGTALFSFINSDVVRVLIGLTALGFVAFQLARARGWLVLGERRLPTSHGLGWGAAAGFTSFVSHAGGPPAAVYLLSQKIDKLSYQATTVVLFSAINAIKFFCYIAIGMFSARTLVASATLAPVGILAGLAGVWAHNLIPEKWFFRLTYLFLSVTGIKLIFDALT